jgi:hypothetical protein
MACGRISMSSIRYCEVARWLSAFSDLQLAFEFVSSGDMGENEAYLDRRFESSRKGQQHLNTPLMLIQLKCTLIHHDHVHFPEGLGKIPTVAGVSGESGSVALNRELL